MRPIFFIVAFFIASFASGQAQPELKRKAILGVNLQKLPDVPGAVVTDVTPGSPAQKAGILPGDRVIQINAVSIPDKYTLLKMLRRIRAGGTVQFSILRHLNSTPVIRSFVPVAAPYETYANLSIEPIVLTNDFGHRLRAFVTKPKQARGKFPAILFVSWLSCSTIENTDLNDSWTKMLREVAEQSGAMMLRLEKPGVGDSEGPACADCDLITELNGYRAALRYLKSRNDVDTTNIIIFGGSLGGTLAPIVGEGYSIKAYISAVSVYKTWLEHMIELERRRLFLSGKSQAEVTQQMQGYIEFYTTYLAKYKTPQEVIHEQPHLAHVWYDDPVHQYGRPAAFYHQLQARNFMLHWSQVQAPVLIVAGEYDWMMTLEDSQLLTDQLNARQPGLATRLIGKGMNHHWMKFNTPSEAFHEINGTYDSETVAKMIAWIKKTIDQ